MDARVPRTPDTRQPTLPDPLTTLWLDWIMLGAAVECRSFLRPSSRHVARGFILQKVRAVLRSEAALARAERCRREAAATPCDCYSPLGRG